MSLPLTHADAFYAMARERYNIKLRRDAGQPWPWTENRIMQEWRFTNVFREDDATTKWFREHIRGVLSNNHPSIEWTSDYEFIRASRLKIVQATLIFRWFNRITTGEIIKDLLIYDWDTEEARRRLKDVRPVVTGAYMIKTFNDMNKLDGILLAIDGALPMLPRMVPNWGTSLQAAHRDLTTIHFLGGFMAHEIVQDLRYTPVLENATDVMTWGHLGPGAIRGMSWVVYGDESSFTSSPSNQRLMLGLMRDLLVFAKDPNYWPQEWPAWELHQVEFGLCEFSKYMKAKSGIPQKRRYQR